MTFQLRNDWSVSFLEADCKTSVGRTLKFASPDRIVEAAQRGGAVLDLSTRQELEHGISIGRGGVWLFLTTDQYAKLR